MNTAITNQAIAGLMPPSVGEARIRDAYPSVSASFAIATLGHRLTKTIFLAPIGWLIMSVPYFAKLLPGLARKYCLTSRRVMIRSGWKCTPSGEVALADIDEVRIVTDANSNFFRAANLELVKAGKVMLTLPGVPEPEAFRQAILTAADAWVPGRCKAIPFISAGDYKA